MHRSSDLRHPSPPLYASSTFQLAISLSTSNNSLVVTVTIYICTCLAISCMPASLRTFILVQRRYGVLVGNCSCCKLARAWKSGATRLCGWPFAGNNGVSKYVAFQENETWDSCFSCPLNVKIIQFGVILLNCNKTNTAHLRLLNINLSEISKRPVKLSNHGFEQKSAPRISKPT